MSGELLSFAKNKRIGFFGIGKTNLALLRELSESETEIVLRSDGHIERGIIPEGLNIKGIFEGERSCESIREDVIFFSPSVNRERRELLRALGRGVTFTSDTEFFLKYNTAPLLLVTGTDGKTTTATLACDILRHSGKRTVAIGNIGRAATPELDTSADYFVMEASSFMLEYCTPRSARAVLTSLSPDHISWHGGYGQYKSAKMRGLHGAREKVISLDSTDAVSLLSDIRKNNSSDIPFALTSTKYAYRDMAAYEAKYYYSVENEYLCKNGEPLIAVSELLRREEYNIRSMLCALALTAQLVEDSTAVEVLRGFRGIKHRCETVCEIEGVRFIDSSIDTSPTRSATTLSSLNAPIIMLLGGLDKGLDSEPLRKAMNGKVVHAVLFGKDGEKIGEELPHDIPKSYFTTLEAAVEFAVGIARRNDTVLLSPAAASYDQFSSFEERGEKFGKILGEILARSQS